MACLERRNNGRFMKCPHCTVDFHVEEKNIYIDKDQEGIWAVAVCRCSACQKLVIRLLSARDLNRAWRQSMNGLLDSSGLKLFQSARSSGVWVFGNLGRRPVFI